MSPHSCSAFGILGHLSRLCILTSTSSDTGITQDQLDGMPAAGKAPWTLFAVAILFQGVPDAIAIMVQVGDRVNHDIFEHNASRTSAHTLASTPPPHHLNFTGCTSSFDQAGYPCTEAIDGQFDDSTNGWAYFSYLPASVELTLDSPSSVSSLVLYSGVGRADHHINDFAIAVKVGGGYQPIFGLAFAGFVGAGNIDGNTVTCFGQEVISLTFDAAHNVTAIKIVVFGSDAPNDNAVLSEMFAYAPEILSVPVVAGDFGIVGCQSPLIDIASSYDCERAAN